MQRTLLVAVLLASSTALASRTGIFVVGSSGCNQCHAGGVAPTVTFALPKSEVKPGEKITASISFTAPNGNTGGFNLTASAGTMSISSIGGAGVQVSANRATHTMPKAMDANGSIQFNVDWTAPLVTSNTTVTLTAYVNSVNGDNRDVGDRGAQQTKTITICANSYFQDLDGDGFGSNATRITECTPPAGFVAQGNDCDDANPDVHPGMAEACNMVDDDCDGAVDDGADSTFYVDGDGDGFGDSANAKTACTQPAGYVMNGTDCDDANPAVHPEATESCNGVDDNCNGLVDESVVSCASNPTPDAGTSGGMDGGAGPVPDNTAGGCGCGASPAQSFTGALLALIGFAVRRERRFVRNRRIPAESAHAHRSRHRAHGQDAADAVKDWRAAGMPATATVTEKRLRVFPSRTLEHVLFWDGWLGPFATSQRRHSYSNCWRISAPDDTAVQALSLRGPVRIARHPPCNCAHP